MGEDRGPTWLRSYPALLVLVTVVTLWCAFWTLSAGWAAAGVFEPSHPALAVLFVVVGWAPVVGWAVRNFRRG